MDKHFLDAFDAKAAPAIRVLSDTPTKQAGSYSLLHRPARRCGFWWDATAPRAADAIGSEVSSILQTRERSGKKKAKTYATNTQAL